MNTTRKIVCPFCHGQIFNGETIIEVMNKPQVCLKHGVRHHRNQGKDGFPYKSCYYDRELRL